jgi:hypothetical protein
MKLIVGLITLLASFTVAALTAYAIKDAGGLDVLSVLSILVAVLLFLAGVSALKSEDP